MSVVYKYSYVTACTTPFVLLITPCGTLRNIHCLRAQPFVFLIHWIYFPLRPSIGKQSYFVTKHRPSICLLQ